MSARQRKLSKVSQRSSSPPPRSKSSTSIHMSSSVRKTGGGRHPKLPSAASDRREPPPRAKTAPALSSRTLSATSFSSRAARQKDLSGDEETPDAAETAASASTPSSTFVEVEEAGARHLYPVRVQPSNSRGPPPDLTSPAATLKVGDLTDVSAVFMQSLLPNLVRLDLSHTSISYLPDDFLGALENLRKLRLDCNDLSSDSFPAGFGASLPRLQDLSVACNRLRTLPGCWRGLRRLTRLNLSDNDLQDLHGIDHFKRLILLVVDRNPQLSSSGGRELFALRRLEGLYCAQTALRAVSGEIRSLQNLKLVDFSNNALASVPSDLFTLPHLEHLSLRHNLISRLPVFNVQGLTKRRIARVDLSQNQLSRLPDHVLRITEHLDLSENRIRTIMGAQLKRVHSPTTQTLDLIGNPLVFPPREVAEQGLHAMQRFFRELEANPQVFQGVKVYVLGARGAGKTSLLRSLVDKQPLPTDAEERTEGVSLLETLVDVTTGPVGGGAKRARNVTLALWDWAGDERYAAMGMHFLRDYGLVLLCFDATRYRSELFEELLGRWLRYVLVRFHRAKVLLVATHADLMDRAPSNVERLSARVLTDARAFIAEFMSAIEKDIRNIESNKSISSALSVYFKHLHLLQQASVSIVEPLFVTSALDYSGIQLLEWQIVELAQVPDVYPTGFQQVPSAWADADTFVEDLAENAPLIEWHRFEAAISKRFSGAGNKPHDIASFLALSGKLLWRQMDSLFGEHVVLKPQTLADAIAALFAFGAPDCTNPNLQDPELLSGPLVFYGEQFLRYGLVTYDLLYHLWVRACHLVPDTQLLPLARYVFEKLELGYSADGLEFNEEYQRHRRQRSRPATGKSASSATSRASSELRFADVAREQLGELIFAPNVRCALPDSARPELDAIVAAYPSLCAVFQLHQYNPPLLFERLVCRLQRCNWSITWHWFENAIAKHNEAGALTLHCYVRRLTPDSSRNQSVTCVCIKIVGGSLFAPDELADGSPPAAAAATSLSSEKQQPAPAGESRAEAEAEGTDAATAGGQSQSLERLAQLARTPVDKFLVDQLWVHLMPVVNAFEELLQEFVGAWFRRMMECPLCHEVVFNGEWLSRRSDADNATSQGAAGRTEPCPICTSAVPEFLLVQPREKRSVEEIRKLRAQMRERTASSLSRSANNSVMQEHEDD